MKSCETSWEVCRAVHKRWTTCLGSRRDTWSQLPFSPDTSRRVRKAPTGQGLVENPSFQKVPEAMLNSQDWDLRARPYKHVEDNMLVEARGVVRRLERIAFTEPGRNLRQLMLRDNLALTLIIGRCRRIVQDTVVIRRVVGQAHGPVFMRPTTLCWSDPGHLITALKRKRTLTTTHLLTT